jgi:hypothetical protein
MNQLIKNKAHQKVEIKRNRNQITDGGRELGGVGVGGKEQLEPEEMIETDAAKGKAALGNGITWNRKRESVVLKRAVG